MGRHSCCYKQKLRKGLWSPEEDEKLLRHITKYGHGCWSSVPKQAGLQRCGKSCRLRWINYLRPDLKRGTFSEDEENLIVELHKVLGNRWSQIAAQLPGRTDNEIKNLWNSCLKKKLRQRGIDPVTHKPLSEVENGAAHVTTTNSIEMVSGMSNELNLLQVDNSNSNSNSGGGATILERRSSLVSSRGYPPEVEGNSGSKMAKSNNNINNSGNRVTPTSNKDFFLDRFVNSHNESSTTTSSHPSDFMGYFPLQQLNYASSNRTSVNPNSTLWFTQPGSKTYDMNSEFSSINNTMSAVLPPMNSLKSSSTAFHSQSPSSMSSSFDVNGCRYWEVGASSNSSSSSGSNSSAELHNNNNNNNNNNSNGFENSLFSWGLADCSTSDKDSQIHLMETVQEDIKWPEILRNPFLMSAATFQSQAPQQPLYNEIKSETQFDSRNISAMWPHHNQQQQQQEPLQNSADICTAAFGHI